MCEPLSSSLSLIITFCLIRLRSDPICLSAKRLFVHFVSAFHTWSLEAAKTWHVCGTGHARSNPQDNSCVVENMLDVGIGRGRVGDRSGGWLWGL